MATVSVNELELFRRQFARGRNPTWTKPQVNAAVQAIEDTMTSASNVGPRSIKTQIGQAIEAAAPGVFSAALKDDLFVLWCRYNVMRNGLL